MGHRFRDIGKRKLTANMSQLGHMFTTAFNSGVVCGASDYCSGWKSSLYLTEQSGHTQSSGNSLKGVPGASPPVHRQGPDDTDSRSMGIHRLSSSGCLCGGHVFNVACYSVFRIQRFFLFGVDVDPGHISDNMR